MRILSWFSSAAPLAAVGFLLIACSTVSTYQPNLEELKTKAQSGHIAAQVWLGSKYDHGDGVKQDYVEAAKWYAMAATAGNAIAQNSLGSLYQEGLGVPRDYVKAMEFFRKSAEQGDANAQCSLGIMYDEGQGVARNPVEANAWYRKAAEQGFPRAMLNLGLSYKDGSGVPQDVVQAFMWLDLGRFYTQFSEDMTVKWRVRGYLDEVKKAMTREQIEQGKALSRELDQRLRAKNQKA